MNNPKTIKEILSGLFRFGAQTEHPMIPNTRGKLDQALAELSTIVRDIIGEDSLSASIPLGMPEQTYNSYKGADELRAKQRLKAKQHGLEL
jgi:hypothetical protein